MGRSLIFLALAALLSGCMCCSGGSGPSPKATTSLKATSTTLFDCDARKDSLGEFCRMKRAIEEGDVNLCREVKLLDYNRLCKAAVNEDPDLCGEYFLNQNDVLACAAVVGDRPKNCEAVEYRYRDGCYMGYAAVLGRPAFCEKMHADRDGCRLIANWRP